MIISVASGKGGTGKTTISVNLAFSLDKGTQFLDCDVEEPNAHIFIKPAIKNKLPIQVPFPTIDKDLCDFCGTCARVCEYNAIAVLKDRVLVFPELCHGCGACVALCPKKAISESKRTIGYVEIGVKRDLQFVHGKLNIGEAMSPPLIRAVKRYINPTRTVIIDVPPGTSCPPIESIKGSDFCILVTEPTAFGLYDLTLAVEVLRKLKVPFGVAINRSGLGDKKVYRYCKKEDIPLLMELPFEKKIAEAYSKGILIIEALPEYKVKFKELYKKIESMTR